MIAKRQFIPGKGRIISEYFPADDRSLPKITTLCRQDVNDMETDPIWAEVSLAEKECLDFARMLHTEVSAIIEEMTSIYTNPKNKNRPSQQIASESKRQEGKEADESDWLAQYMRNRKIDPRGSISQLQYEGIRRDCLHDLNERLDGRQNIIQLRIEEETENISRLDASLKRYHDEEGSPTDKPELTEIQEVLKKKEDAETQLKVLKKRLFAHDDLVQSKREVRILFPAI